MLNYTLTIMNIENVSASHIHIAARGENGGVSIPIASDSFETASDEVELSAEQLDALLSEMFYVNVHTSANPGGEIRGQIEFDVVSVDGGTPVHDWLFVH